MKKTLILIITMLSINICFTSSYLNVHAEENNVDLSIIGSIGGNSEDCFDDIKIANDGGFVAVGYSKSNDGEFINKGDADAIIVRYNKDGDKQWVANFGGIGNDYFKSVVPTDDGGVVCVGSSESSDIGFTNKGGVDAIIVKYDENGNELWFDNWGGGSSDYFESAIATSDGGVICVGNSESVDAGFTNKGGADAIIVKYDKNGNELWNRGFGGTYEEYFKSVTTSKDGGYVAVGYNRMGFINRNTIDAIIVGYDKDGNEEWTETFGGSHEDCFESVTRATDDGFLAVGYSFSSNAEFTNKGSDDAIVVKYDKNGNKLWVKNWGGSNVDHFNYIAPTSYGGFLAVGYSQSYNAGFTWKGYYDAIVVEYDKDGNELWVKNWAGSKNESFNSVAAVTDGGYVVAGYSASSDVGFNNKGKDDGVVVKINKINGATSNKPTISTSPDKKKIEMLDNNNEISKKELQYKINNGAWNTYTTPFEPIYDSRDICKIEAKSINRYNVESDITIVELKKNLGGTEKIENSLNIIFQQPHSLSISLNSNTIDFGEVTGLEEVEMNDLISITVTSSSSYNVDIKGADDIKGSNDSSNIIGVNNLKVKVDSNPYIVMSKNYTTLIGNSLKGININHMLNFKLNSTLGAKADSYSIPLKINVSQI